MTTNEMMSVIDDLKPQFKEEFGLVDLRCDVQINEGDNVFYKCETILITEQGAFLDSLRIRIDISRTFIKKAIDTHIRHLLCDIRKGAGYEKD